MLEQGSLRRDSQYRKTLSIVITVLAITTFAAIYIPMRIKARINERLENSLQTVLRTTDSALQIWAERSEDEASVLAGRPGLSSNVQRQLRAYLEHGDLATPELRNIRQVVANAIQIYRWLGFAVIEPNGVQIAAATDEALGAATIVKHNPMLWPTVKTGRIFFGLPFQSSLLSKSKVGDRPYMMIIAAPIRDDVHNVIAALALWIDPNTDFAETVQLGRWQNTGETYAFDRTGRLIIESRFEQGLERSSPKWSDAVAIRDPGGDTSRGFTPPLPRDAQPLTRMSQSAIRGESGIDIQGYRDYRGVPVVGAWLWNSRLNIGLATEMDVDEAFATSRAVQRLTVFMLVIVIAGAAALVFMVANRARLQALAANYQRAVRAREDLMAIVSHDLKNPINSMVLRTSILMNKLDAATDQSVFIRKQLELVKSSAHHMDKLVSDLTDLTRIESGNVRIEKQETTVALLVSPVLDTFGPLITEKKLEFNMDVPSNLPPVLADPARIGQILSNLLGNAIKFTPEHGSVALDVKPAGKEIQFAVSDSGPGISKEALPHVFEQYWQVTRNRSGIGLGLFIGKSLVEAHGGRIWVDTTPGKGTTVTFTLPY